MLITTCTHCLARFRVTPQQLNARQGQVRCGRCRKVFSGFEALERYPDDDTGSRLLAAREAELKVHNPVEESESIPLEDLPEAPSTPSAPPTPHPEKEAAPKPAEIAAKPAEPRKMPVSTPYLATQPAPPPARVARAWALGVVLLAFVFAAEIAYAARGALAQRYPVLRPAMESICGAFGCAIPWPNNDALLKLEDSELLEVPGKANQIALAARIRNLAPAAQEYPYLELTLTDLTGQAAARRVLRPSEYMGRPVAAGEVLAAGAEIAIQLRLETRDIRATGYELLLFYP
jgi:predicted Zn finger-like uncharacterized protein